MRKSVHNQINMTINSVQIIVEMKKKNTKQLLNYTCKKKKKSRSGKIAQ